jgi:hypothetical protein
VPLKAIPVEVLSPDGDQPYAPPAEAPVPGSNVLGRLKVVAILGIILGGLSLLWALLMAVEIPLALSGALDEGRGPDDPPREVMAAVFLVLLLLSLGLGLLQILSGVRTLKRQRGARGLGLACGIASICSLWVCCLYPFCLAFGIFALVTFASDDVRRALE